MRSRSRPSRLPHVPAWGAMVLALAAGSVRAQSAPAPPAVDQPAWIRTLAKDPDSPAMRAYAEQQRKRVAAEKDLKKLRYEYFRKRKTPDQTAAGLEKLKAYTDPALFPSLVEIFSDEDAPVRRGLVNHFASLGTPDADTTLAWIAVFNKHPDTRAQAADRVASRAKATGGITAGARLTILHAIANGSEIPAGSAAHLASTVGLIEAIPLLINAQVGSAGGGGGGGGAGDGRGGDLAFIFVGTQRAYVSDLTPVVGDSAVGFDPTISVLTEGALLRIGDATVTVNRTVIHEALVDFTTREWGRSTDYLAYDLPAWRAWYEKDFLPTLAKRAEPSAKEQEREAARRATDPVKP